MNCNRLHIGLEEQLHRVGVHRTLLREDFTDPVHDALWHLAQFVNVFRMFGELLNAQLL